ncbi:hypothetical protein CHCC20441_2526 [Bacillus licheniformis]|uniref:Uncharacterized protein n=1 Tax=Bacillus licheniformis TaxID=1402 RepID=A0A8B5YD28_BACLI|nr:hypothetical protein B4091_0999 [Bacillus licheniformis]TWJ46677.1 hypothetical protein CHCC5025_0059 [Bacillus licheniformis]TWJ93568.1 hypothetical protein CHCC20495_1565 [Bacillus licheniformis]TWK13101.1 hypothetical protein CHCC20441_2526 [Bacillus licheniformis]TWK16891.1 hypothetical protein CHCC20373_0911 [Bacillus licheniformis]
MIVKPAIKRLFTTLTIYSPPVFCFLSNLSDDYKGYMIFL